jgi:hypothetical protein
MGRPTHEPKHLLDVDAEQNIGNSTNLQPQDGSGLAGGTVTAQTNPDRILQLSGPSKTAQTTSVVFTASRLTGSSNNPNPGYAGPVTGIVEFGNGGRFTRAEFDIPLGPFVGFFQGAASNTEPQDGGVVVTVPSGVLRAYARYDNRLIQPVLGTVPPLSLAQILGVPFAGPGGPVRAPAPGAQVAPAEPVLVKAMAAYYTRHYAKLYKTQYCYVSSPGTPAQQIQQGLYCVPAFARSVQVLRSPSAAMTVELFDGLYNGNPVNVAALNTVNVLANTTPEIPIVGTETIIRVSSATANDTVYLLALCYEIGL